MRGFQGESSRFQIQMHAETWQWMCAHCRAVGQLQSAVHVILGSSWRVQTEIQRSILRLLWVSSLQTCRLWRNDEHGDFQLWRRWTWSCLLSAIEAFCCPASPHERNGPVSQVAQDPVLHRSIEHLWFAPWCAIWEQSQRFSRCTKWRSGWFTGHAAEEGCF